MFAIWIWILKNSVILWHSFLKDFKNEILSSPLKVEEEVQMEVDPPKDEGGDKKESANAEAAPAPNPEEPPKADQDAEMKDAEGSKAAEDAPKKEYRTEKRKKVVSKTIDLPVTSRVIGALSRDKLEAAIEQEKTLTNQDAYEANRLVAKNRYSDYHVFLHYLKRFYFLP